MLDGVYCVIESQSDIPETQINPQLKIAPPPQKSKTLVFLKIGIFCRKETGLEISLLASNLRKPCWCCVLPVVPARSSAGHRTGVCP